MIAAELKEKQKTLLIGAGLGVAVVVISMAPLAVPVGTMLQSLFPALSAGLTATALVLIYRTVRVINFAQIAMGAIAAQLFYEFYTRSILPFPVALLIGIAAGAIMGLLIGVIAATLFFRHPRLVMTVVTIFMTGLVGFVQGTITGAFDVEGEVTKINPIPLPGGSIWNKKVVTIDLIPFRVAHVIALVLLLGITISLVIFFRRTRVGTAVRASAENSDRAALLGINVKALQVGVWALVGVTASIAAVGSLPITQYNQAAFFNQTDLLLPLSAAVVARMTSMPVAFTSAVGMVLMERSINYAHGGSALIQVGLLAILMIGLLVQRKRMQARADESTSWRGVKEVRPTPREMLALPVIARTRRAMYLVGIAAALGIPWLIGSSGTGRLTGVWTFALIGVSLVILTGWSGQISLGQMAFVAVGAYAGGNMTLKMNIPFLVALPLAGMLGAIFAVIIGIPALRIRGLFLAATTFAIAIVLPLILFDPEFLGNSVPRQSVTAPKFLFLDFSEQRSMYYLTVLFFFLIVAGVQALRRSRGGRVLIALRDNEAGVQSFGIDIVRTRLTAFAISGFIAAFAGALYVHQAKGMDPSFFNAFASINVFVVVVIGGVSSVSGAFLGAAFFIGGAILFANVFQVIQGVTGLFILMAIPGGLTQIVFGARDAVLRVIAMRQHIVVPSLFADYSPEAWEKRLAPLAPASQSQGLAALKVEQRYSMPSRVFGEVGT